MDFLAAGGGTSGGGLLHGCGIGYSGELCLGGHDFFVLVFGFVSAFFVGCVVVVDDVFICVAAYAYC